MEVKPRRCVPLKTVIRQLPITVWVDLKRILDPNDKWKELASIIKARNGTVKYNGDDMLNLELQLRSGHSPTEALLQSWAMDNVTASTLRDTLIEAGLIRAANILNKVFGEKEIEENPPQLPQPPHDDLPRLPPIHLPANMLVFGYDILELATGGFNPTPFRDGGNLIGKGGFGQVFIGESMRGKIAVKRLNNINNQSDEHVQFCSSGITQQFNKEIEIMARFKHENILQLIGYSTDGPHYCIVTAYMENGSLQDRLACLDDTNPLTVSQRIDIAVDTARAIKYLHTHEQTPIIHRDVKSANILLDKDFTGKLADCALARPGPTNKLHSATYTHNIIGTTVYMPPELKLSGATSTKIDSYSYGVVLLELLTGLPSYDESREDIGLPEHISELIEQPEDILSLVDRSANDWPDSVAIAIYKLVERCLDHKKRRPEISEILSEMEKYKIAGKGESEQASEM